MWITIYSNLFLLHTHIIKKTLNNKKVLFFFNMSPPEVKTAKQLGTLMHSHGIEVYHKHNLSVDHDAGFNLQKWAWVEQKNSSESFMKVRVIDDDDNDDDDTSVLVEYEDGSNVSE